MSTQADLIIENRIRKGLKFVRLFVAYAPFGVVRRLQTLPLIPVKLPPSVQTKRVTKPLGEWFTSSEADDHSPVILYFHGGGFVFPQAPMHRTMLAKITHDVKGRTFTLDYRLAPEHPFPAALEDCVEAYQYLLSEGIAPEQITVMGDSAGANLTLALLLALRDKHLPLPKLGICISAPTDLTDDNPAHGAGDAILHPRSVRRFSSSYLAHQDAHNPLISPLFADLRGLPPLILYAGSEEALSSDSVRFVKVAEAAGVDVKLHVYPRMWHVWQLTPELPQARQSLDEIAEAVRMTCQKVELEVTQPIPAG
jgi:acetyl esterase/lipase